MKRFLIVKTSALGDIVHAFPVARYLKERFPEAQIDWVAEESAVELVRANPDVSNVFCLQTKKWRKSLFTYNSKKEMRAFCKMLRTHMYEAIFDLQGNIKSGMVTFLARGKHKVGFGSKTVAEWPNILATNARYNPEPHQNIRTDYLSIVQQFFNDITPWKISPTKLVISSEESKIIDEILSQSSTKKIILETAIQGDKVMQDFESGSFAMGVDHSQKVKATPIANDYGSKDCVNLSPSIAVSRIMVCPGAAWPNKQLSLSTLSELLQSLLKKEASFFLFTWGSAQEKKNVETLHSLFPNNSAIVPKMSLPVLQNLMSKVDLVIAMDSLPLHLAGTTQTATFSVFGPSSAEKYCPLGSQHHAFQGPCPYGRTFEKRCPILRTCPTGLCIKGLKSDRLIKIFRDME